MSNWKAEPRPSKETDQEETEKAYQILNEAMLQHPEIEPSLWTGACWSALVNGYLNSQVPFKEFCIEFDCAKEFYRDRWEEQDG